MAWTSWASLFVGVWLVFSPAANGAERGALAVSDLVAGLLTVLLAASDIRSARLWKKWVICFVGVWLILAPIILWARTPAGYGNDTLAGVFLVVFSITFASQWGSTVEIPAGWSYNPSDWGNRVAVVALAFFGFFVARCLASFQLGHAGIWDPFFGDGTRRVLTSEVARAFPVSDAGLGAAAYLLEALSGLIGDERRWRTMPWMVFLFFVLVVPAGVASIVLIMLQPVAVGAWCTLCLVTAATTLLSIPPAVDEVFASWQFLAERRRAGDSVWRVFWAGRGGPPEPPDGGIEKSPSGFLNGIGFTWPLAGAAALGIWVVVAPGFLGVQGRAADSDYVAGALVTTFAVLATAEPVRTLRFVALLFCAWIAASPFVLSGHEPVSRWAHVATGIAGAALCFPRGRVLERYGAWTRFIR